MYAFNVLCMGVYIYEYLFTAYLQDLLHCV